jgi:Sec-independent protein translocase protein TatA
MLSFSEGGRKIARVKGGKDDGKIIYLDEQGFDGDIDIKSFSKKFYKEFKKLSKEDGKELMASLNERNPPEKEALREIFMDAMDEIKGQKKNEIRITGGKLLPLPNKKVVEKIYVSAPSGAGKSTWCGNWIKEFKKVFRDDEYFVFSTINRDKVLDKHDPIRIPLTEDLLVNPISPNEVENAVVVFDDVDTITNPKIRNNIVGLRDWLLEQGRHFNTRMLMTSHLLMNYSATRRLLNEATAVVFFGKCGSTYHIKRFLKQYAGLDKKQIKRILNLPSRWVALYKTYPMYILYEKGAYLLSNDDDD